MCYRNKLDLTWSNLSKHHHFKCRSQNNIRKKCCQRLKWQGPTHSLPLLGLGGLQMPVGRARIPVEWLAVSVDLCSLSFHLWQNLVQMLLASGLVSELVLWLAMARSFQTGVTIAASSCFTAFQTLLNQPKSCLIGLFVQLTAQAIFS